MPEPLFVVCSTSMEGQRLPQLHAILSTISTESLTHVYLELEPCFRIHLVFTKFGSDLASSGRLFEFLANSDVLSRIDELPCRLVNLKVDTPSSDASLKLTSLGSTRQQLATLQGAKSTLKSYSPRRRYKFMRAESCIVPCAYTLAPLL